MMELLPFGHFNPEWARPVKFTKAVFKTKRGEWDVIY